MYSDKRNILQLTSLMLSFGIRRAVVCPGSRNAAIVHTFIEAGIQCTDITDERSAGFVAIGLANATGEPVAVCCTSGSAVLNLAPAVSEAYYQSVPLLIVTADRPECWIGQMDAQTMPQPSAYGSMVHRCVTLAEPSWDDTEKVSKENAWYNNRLINEALNTMVMAQGPVHINVPISEPLFNFTHTSLPEERVIKVYKDISDVFSIITGKGSKVMLLLGQMSRRQAESLMPYIQHIVSNMPDIVICSELLSFISGNGIIGNFDNALENKHTLPPPDFVITMGGHIVSKRMKEYLRMASPYHIHVSGQQPICDLFQCLRVGVCCEPQDFLKGFITIDFRETETSFRDSWTQTSILTERNIQQKSFEGFCEPLAVRIITESDSIPQFNVHLANSSIVRQAQTFPGKLIGAYCNRGINGIEGSMSAAVGHYADCHPTLLLTGDLSFFYDQNALWNSIVQNAESDVPLRIILLNNGGGRIFRTLPGLEASPYRDKSISGKHQTTAEGIAMQNRCQYNRISTEEELRDQLSTFLNPSGKGVAIMEIMFI